MIALAILGTLRSSPEVPTAVQAEREAGAGAEAAIEAGAGAIVKVRFAAAVGIGA